jgi:hypothetical protein
VVAPVLTWDEVEPDEAEGALTVRPTAAGG